MKARSEEEEYSNTLTYKKTASKNQPEVSKHLENTLKKKIDLRSGKNEILFLMT